MKEEHMRICLAMIVMLNGRFSVEIKKSNKSEFGYTVDPKIFIASGNSEKIRKYITGVLRYFKMGWSPQTRQLVTVITRYSDLRILMDELLKSRVEFRGIFTTDFTNTLETFYDILDMYGNREHYKKEGFFTILDLRMSFMPQALSRQAWIERTLGE